MGSVPVEYSEIGIMCDTSVPLNSFCMAQRSLMEPNRSCISWELHESKLFYETVKRIFDLLLAGAAIVFASPIMVVIAVMIKLESKGPVLFKQFRIGCDRRKVKGGNGHLHEPRKFNLGGKPFTIYKFRTMRAEVEAYAFRPKEPDDLRLTKVGRGIRRLCLDELPQLWNVIKGDMSLVGPRPEMPHIVQSYGVKERMRLTVKPGLTGLWQLKGSRNQMIHQNLHYDLEYLRRRSLFFDLGILFRTIPFVLGLSNV